MRLLIVSDELYRKQHLSNKENILYQPPYDVEMEFGDLNSIKGFHLSAFDYDVSIIIIERKSSDIGYYYSLPKLVQDVYVALDNGRSVILLPKSDNFIPESNDHKGYAVYAWVKNLGIELRSNIGAHLRASGAGKAQVIQNYLKYAPQYHQVVANPKIPVTERLAVVEDTDIVVGLEHSHGKGTLVILPPPLFNSDNYFVAMSALVGVAKRYYEKAQRSISFEDTPEWLPQYWNSRAKDLNEQIKNLMHEKAELDQIAYVLYGTGDELEHSASLLLQKLGLTVNREPPGANIDLKAKHSALGLGFAIEVTGTKGTIQKETKKIAQAWQYLSERIGTSEEQDRLIILANTQCNISPNKRKDNPFSENVVKLLGDKGVLLITTFQLYNLWEAVCENRTTADDVIKDIYSKSGVYT